MEPLYDILIEMRGKNNSTGLINPEHADAFLHFTYSMDRRGGGQPISETVVAPFESKVLLNETDDGQLPHIIHINAGGYWVSDRIKNLLEELSSPCMEFFPTKIYSVNRRADLENSNMLGAPSEEPHWLFYSYNMQDVIDREKSETEWFTGDPRLNATNKYHSDEDPPEVSEPKKLVLSRYPDDHVYGVTGLPDYRFVSPELYDRIMRSGLVRWPGTFRAYFLEKRHWAMPDTRLPKEQRQPVRINGRVLHYGSMSDPID